MAETKHTNSNSSLNSKVDSSPANNKGTPENNKNKNLDNGHKTNSSTKKRKMNHNPNSGPGPSPGPATGNSSYNGQFNVHRLSGSPAWDLQPLNTSGQTFTGRCRLFVANLPSSVNEESLRKLFSEFGKISDIFIGKANQFAFIKMDTRSNAENARNSLDGKLFEGRTLRVRLAAHAAAIKVTNLPPCVSNELLHLAFSTFGPIERAIVAADDRGRSLNEGIVEFARKSSAQAAIKKCQQECLLLSATPTPVVVTSLECRDEDEGVPEKNVLHTAEYRKERELGPRFSEPGSIEFEIANKWKQLSQIEAQRREAFENEIRDMHENFKAQMEYFRLEETTKKLREQLRQMEADVQKLNSQRDARYDFERQREDQRRQHDSMLRSQSEQLVGQHTPADLNSLRRQESELRQQANALQQLLDRQETQLRQMNVEQPMGPQHMDTPMYGQHAMGGHNPSGMMQGQMPPPPVSNQMPMQGLYGPQSNSSMNHQQHPSMVPHQQHPQMVPHPHQMQPPSPIHRAPMGPGPYNGHPSGPNMPHQGGYNTGHIGQPPPPPHSHPGNSNYGKRTRRPY